MHVNIFTLLDLKLAYRVRVISSLRKRGREIEREKGRERERYRKIERETERGLPAVLKNR